MKINLASCGRKVSAYMLENETCYCCCLTYVSEYIFCRPDKENRKPLNVFFVEYECEKKLLNVNSMNCFEYEQRFCWMNVNLKFLECAWKFLECT